MTATQPTREDLTTHCPWGTDGDERMYVTAPRSAWPARYHDYAFTNGDGAGSVTGIILRLTKFDGKYGLRHDSCRDPWRMDTGEVDAVLAVATKVESEVEKITNEEVAGRNAISFGTVFARWSKKRGWEYVSTVDRRRLEEAWPDVIRGRTECKELAQKAARKDSLYGRPALAWGVGGPQGDDRPTLG